MIYSFFTSLPYRKSLLALCVGFLLPTSQVLAQEQADKSAIVPAHLLCGPSPVKAERQRPGQAVDEYQLQPCEDGKGLGKRGGHATIRVDRAGARVLRISVQDDGGGIPIEKQPRIFEPFYRAGQEAGAIEGTGIGLAISRRLTELMGGKVGFTSSPGEGSTFWLDLPAHEATREPRRGAPEQRDALGKLLSGDGEVQHHVLYIEDNPSNIAFMEDLLSDFARVELMTAPTAEIGLELARGRLPTVILMDINLPGISGLEATRRLKEWPETRHIPVIALSAAATPRDTARAAEVGFHRYLTKPVEVDRLVDALEELLPQT